MKSTKKIFLIFALAILVFSGCGKFLDINHDPNSPQEVTMDLVFPAGVENAASVIGNYYFVLGEIWAQHWTSDANAPDYQAEDSYNVTAGDFSYDIAGWSNLYSNSLMDLEWVRKEAYAEKNWSFYLAATTLQSYVYQVLADFYEQIPLSDALQQHSPVFDNGQQVYDTLIARLDTALNRYKNCYNCKNLEAGDVIFNGDMEKWVAFANTLKLKIFMREIEKRPSIAIQGIKDMYNSGVAFIEYDVTFDDFADESGRDNYFYGREYRSRGNINMRASKTFIDFIKAFQDPRLDYIFYRPKGEEDDITNHRGMFQGDYRNVYSYPDENTVPEISRPRILPTTPVYFMTKAESYFLQAEAAVRIPELGLDAKNLFESAIEADFERLMSIYKGQDINKNEKLNDINYEDILDVRYYTDFDPNTMPADTLIKRIIVQKWIAMANTQGAEAFFEHNRTGYPLESPINPGDNYFDSLYVKGQFTVSVTGVLPPTNPYPKRLMIPSSEQSRNPNTPSVKSLYEPVWWDKTSNYSGK